MRTIALGCLLMCLVAPASLSAREDPLSLSAGAVQPLMAALEAPEQPGECAAFAAATASRSQGATLLLAHILRDGSVRRARVIASSGSDRLDRAAAACMNAMRLAPKTKDGAPIDVDWQMEVVWPEGSIRTARAAGDAACTSYYPLTAKRAGREGDTLVSFVIGADGSVNRINVIESSGDHSLDAATVECVSRFRYHPAMRDGTPVEIDGNFVAEWRLR